ncbi:signal transduction histidine kinase [Sphingobium sp. B11D3B]|uniref:sensor histidine kinase n=1 Tax=Sphingobium sp. B11D3B TaxID=2940575 RepID=UPI002227651C|nr:ATP-binding protein [Sphingobium sp. B11D3B]MCW2389602.1 signal transduction histidine kinase [Sphingobium sp. B11D3B]
MLAVTAKLDFKNASRTSSRGFALVIGRPAVAFIVGLATLAILLIVSGQLARSLPSYAMTFQSEPDGPLLVAVIEGSPQPLAAPLRVVRITDPSTGSSIAPLGYDDAVRRTERLITPEAIAKQDSLAAMAQSGDLQFILRDSNGHDVELVRQRQLNPLGLPFWIAAASGMLGALIALWVLVLRPHDPSARAIAAAGFALCFAALPFAVLENGEMIVGGALWRLLVTINWMGAHAFGLALVAYFTWFPKPLATRPLRLVSITALAAVAPLMAVFAQSGRLTYDDVSLVISADFLIIVALVVLQWRRSRSHPLGRAALRLVGSATVISLSLFLLMTYMPPLLGASAEWADPLAFVLMLPPFVAIAIGVTRGWMFDLDRWAWRLFASALSLFLIVAVDVILLLATSLAPDTATTVAMVVGAAIWIVMRQKLLESFFARSRRDGAALLAQSGEIALGATEAERFERWQQALENWFRPLSVGPSDHVGQATLENAGVSLLIGAPPFGPALRLYAANHGRSLFHSGDAELVNTLSHLCQQTDAARQAYDRGMYEERERIARDLHDDVGGRLVTSLHRGSLDDARSDVRGAIKEMRQLLAGLRGGRRYLSDVVATCRVDAGDRLEAAGITLIWPMLAITTDHYVRYSVFRAVEATLREAVTNVIRHANAGKVEVAIAVALWDGHPTLSIEFIDDGIGLPASCEEGRGFFNMRKRVGEVGGTVTLSSQQGTQIAMRVPLDMLPPEQGASMRSR